MEYIINFLLKQATVDHGAVGGLFNGEAAPITGKVECLGRFFVLVMKAAGRQDLWWFGWWWWWWWWEE